MQKNEAVSSICSGEKDDLKILQSDWLRIFWTYTCFLIKATLFIQQVLLNFFMNLASDVA